MHPSSHQSVHGTLLLVYDRTFLANYKSIQRNKILRTGNINRDNVKVRRKDRDGFMNYK